MMRFSEEAEGEGFEPSSDLTARNGFRDRRIRPLCHPSVSTDYLDLVLRSGSSLGRRRPREQCSRHGLAAGAGPAARAARGGRLRRPQWAAAKTEKEGFEPSMEVSTPITP